jgi:hypothetical protein
MSDQLPMFQPTTSPDSCSATSSPESASGPTPCGSQDGRTTDQSGPDPVRASRSRKRGSDKARRTFAICGRLGFDSSPSDDLALSLVSKLRPVTDSLGSTMFDMTWKRRVTPAGHSIYALQALGRRTNASVFTSWPSPQASDGSGGGQAKRAMNSERSNNLNDFVMLAAWGTPQSRDHFPAHTDDYRFRQQANGHGIVNLNDQAALAGWGTSKSSDGSGGRTSKTDGGGNVHLDIQARLASWNTPRATDGSKGGPNQANGAPSHDVSLTSWATPAARDWKSGNASQETMEKDSRPLNELALLSAGNSDYTRKITSLVRLTDSGDKPIGFLLRPNGWEIRPASGQLKPGHSRWLMGLPPIFDYCAVTAWAHLKKSKKAACRSRKDAQRESCDLQDMEME